MAMAPPSFLIEASDFHSMLSSSHLSIENLLSAMVSPTKSLARPPISKFFVGAVGLGASGRVFLGVNLEFVGLPLSNSVHAEQFLVANAAQHGERELRLIAVSAAPCGHCRQFLQELRGAPELRVLIADAEAETQTLAHFLPHRFGPNDVLQGEFPLLLEPRANGLLLKPENCDGPAARNKTDCRRSEIDGISWNANDTHDFVSRFSASEESTAQLNDLIDGCRENQCGNLNFSEASSKFALKAAALGAANRSHAPYTNCPSGIALLTRKGKICSGSYMESVAYNPGLPPLQAALVAFVSRDGGNYDDIAQAVLVEKEGAVMQFAATTQLVLQKISPNCTFRVYHASTK